MASHCSLRTGGFAQTLFIPESVQILVDFLKTNTQPILFVGLGSNLLIRDPGFEGVIIKLTQLNLLTLDHSSVTAEAGVTLAKLSRIALANNLHGAEFLSAIPGTVGGALAMNAGAFGSEFWQFVAYVQTINRSGELFQRSVKEFSVNYRQVIPAHKDEFFISAELVFNAKPSDKNIKQLLSQRNASQPIGLPNCGSVFKNPKNHYAAKLIEQSQLKGYCIGGACISEKHANFIINNNHATASDVEKLILHIQQVVKLNFDIDLEAELKII